MNFTSFLVTIVVLAISAGRVQADPDVEKTIKNFFTAMVAGDATGITNVLDEKFAMIQAGRLSATVDYADVSEMKNWLPKKGKELGNFEISSVKIDVSPTHRSVGVASFTLNYGPGKQQLADMKAELKQDPSNDFLRMIIADGGFKGSMLARSDDGNWRIICISIPD